MTGKRVRFHPETDFSEKESTSAIKRRYANLTSTGRRHQQFDLDSHQNDILNSKQQQQQSQPEMCDRWVNSHMDSWPSETHCDLSQLLQPNTQAMTCTTTRSESRDVFNALPSDPREWSRDDVSTWLRFMQRTHPYMSEINVERFSMNGKALCLMSAEMFSMRVPNGGSQLYKDFRFRLSKAMVGYSS